MKGSSPFRTSPVASRPLHSLASRQVSLLVLTAQIAVLVAVLAVLHTHHYLLFHTLAEMFSVVVGGAIFLVAWNTRRFVDTDYFLLIGTGYLFVSILDTLHTLAYQGMTVLPGAGADLAAQLWIQARFLEALGLLTAPFFLGRRIRAGTLLAGFAALTLLGLASLFWWHDFPVCFRAGSGLTGFKIGAEYFIMAMLLLAFWRLRTIPEKMGADSTRYIQAAIVVTVFSELLFTLYHGPYGIHNYWGHIFKVVSFLLLYKGIVEGSLARPYDNLFRNLAEGEKRFRLAIEYFPRSFLIYDRERRIRYINPYAVRLTGLPEEKILGRRDEDILPPEITSQYLPQLQRVFQEMQPLVFDLHSRLPGGEVYMRVHCIPQTDERGRIEQVFCISQDIMDLKKTEELLWQDNERLEALVNERARELSETQVELERNRRLSDLGMLAAGIAHDLRNPLGVIVTALFNLRRKNTDPALDRHFDNIAKKVEESERIIRNLLQYARVQPPELEAVDLGALLEERVEAATARYARGTMEVRLEVSSLRGTSLWADATQLGQVVDNLLDNAFQILERDGGRFFIHGACDGAYTVVRFEDNGPGLPPGEEERIFQPFFSRRSKGTGLGLAISRQIVELHQGTLTAVNLPAGGACFILSLPRQAPPDPAPPAVGGDVSATTAAGTRKTALEPE